MHPRLADALAKFRPVVVEFVWQHKVHSDRSATEYEARRIARFVSERIVSTLGIQFGPDAEALTYEWARTNRLKCLPLASERKTKTKSKGELIDNLLPGHYWRVYPWITFKPFHDLMMDAIRPSRQPITRRTPVSRIH